MKYYIEGKRNLRECTPEECAIIDFAIEIGDSLRLYGNNLYTEDFEEIPYETTNSCWSKLIDITSCWCEDGDERVENRTIWWDLYKELSKKDKAHFMDWIHGKWDFSEETRYYMTGNQMMRAALGQRIALRNGHVLNG